MPNNKRISLLSLSRRVSTTLAQSTAAASRSPPVSLKIACRADKVKMYDWLPEIRYFFTNRVCIRRSSERRRLLARSRTNLLPLALQSCVWCRCARAVNANQANFCVWMGEWVRELLAPPPRSKFILCRGVENSNKNGICRQQAGLMRRKNRETESILCLVSTGLKLCSLAIRYANRPERSTFHWDRNKLLTSASLARI